MKLFTTIVVMMLAGCVTSIGSGTGYGYVEAVGEEHGTPTAYIKSSLSSSKTDVYCVVKDPELIALLKDAGATEARIEFTYETAMCFMAQNSVEGRITKAKKL